MARLHEYQGKALLARHGFVVPRGAPASSAQEAADVARGLGGAVVVKIQAWTTGRAELGGIAFAQNPEEAAQVAGRLLALQVGNFPVTQVLVEEQLRFVRELFVSLSIDDRRRQPVVLLSLSGGSGVEKRAGEVHRLDCDVTSGIDRAQLQAAVDSSDLDGDAREWIADAARRVFDVARAIEARSIEINPLALTDDGRMIAADCRITVDDYAVFRHPELGIDIARELDHPPTQLERIAYGIEQQDHRGTFYFAQLATEPSPGSRGLVGFHGAGGGGSMMSMDAITNEGFTLANFTDTSGNPSAAKVYRAARVILAQPGLCGYFGSGSGVASQEQFWSAYGLAKAFWELNLNIPAVIRLGGNSEERAIDVLTHGTRGLKTTVEGYGKDDPPARIAARFAELVGSAKGARWTPCKPRRPTFVGSANCLQYAINGGRLCIDSDAWGRVRGVAQSVAPGLLTEHDGKPIPAIQPDEFATKDSEMIALEVECRRAGIEGVHVVLEIPGLD
ncbi:MAG: ATP-grasp domain-containing protein [Tepidisphaeraceae bacterium]